MLPSFIREYFVEQHSLRVLQHPGLLRQQILATPLANRKIGRNHAEVVSALGDHIFRELLSRGPRHSVGVLDANRASFLYIEFSKYDVIDHIY